MSVGDKAGEVEFCLALSKMSRLKSLSLCGPRWLPYDHEHLFGTIQLLTALTRLEWAKGQLTNADVAQCASLRELHVLSLLPDEDSRFGPITLQTFLDVAKLPQLQKLQLGKVLAIVNPGEDVYVADDIHNLLNAKRHSRGWPSLDLKFRDAGYAVPWRYRQYKI
jgi:hypothetical protein